MADRTGIELARVGTFDLSTGPQEFTEAMLHDAARRGAEPTFRAPLKLGHTDPRNDGEPAFGWLHNLRVQGSGDQAVLLGDVKDMPQWLADVSPRAYPDRSIEGNVAAAGDGLEITALALLGVTPPGIGTLQSWRDLPAALAASSSTLPLTAFAAAYQALNDSADPAATDPPAEPPADNNTPPKKEADVMSDTITKGLRERLGVKTDAELDEAGLLSALDQALGERATVTPEAIAAAFKLTPDQVTTALAAAAKPAPKADEVTLPDGYQVVSSDVLDELRLAASAGAEARAVQLRGDKDKALTDAVRAGKIAPARRDHWATSWDKDPEGTRKNLDELPAGLLPVAASGFGGDDTHATTGVSDAEADELAGLFGTQKGAFL